jgi:hypothetical protein
MKKLMTLLIILAALLYGARANAAPVSAGHVPPKDSLGGTYIPVGKCSTTIYRYTFGRAIEVGEPGYTVKLQISNECPDGLYFLKQPKTKGAGHINHLHLEYCSGPTGQSITTSTISGLQDKVVIDHWFLRYTGTLCRDDRGIHVISTINLWSRTPPSGAGDVFWDWTQYQTGTDPGKDV